MKNADKTQFTCVISKMKCFFSWEEIQWVVLVWRNAVMIMVDLKMKYVCALSHEHCAPHHEDVVVILNELMHIWHIYLHYALFYFIRVNELIWITYRNHSNRVAIFIWIDWISNANDPLRLIWNIKNRR